ncbi:MAG: GIY-YIG nuclease family protein [Candidatus Buchananbacteria bacterium]|jgi:hypothetical protein
MNKKLLDKLKKAYKEIENSDKITSDSKVPHTGGVYLIKNKKGNKIIYIGKATNLNRRIRNHTSGTINKSIFRKKLLILKPNIKAERVLSLYIKNNYDFYTMEIHDFDFRSLMESLLIYNNRKSNNFILNDLK